MKRVFGFLVFMSVFVVISEGFSTIIDVVHGSNNKIAGHSVITLSDNSRNRMLRTSEDTTTEERNIQSSAVGALSKIVKAVGLKKAGQKLQFKSWLLARRDPDYVLRKFKLKGIDVNTAEKLPGYDVFLAYSKYWNAKGGRFLG
ncbi:Secreted RxLR effector peptide protein [Phytophthora palmivora]|uniref:Secreted RxLR effector peptide protein n=1 Tax=Phytophthora palmivora TaxID=4796 RepID=A0A2P4Y7D0_9STRA|nr:Secreted RxLR effector peptide protein [Phytophthora palmivora]